MYIWVCKFTQHIPKVYVRLSDAAVEPNGDCVYVCILYKMF